MLMFEFILRDSATLVDAGARLSFPALRTVRWQRS